MRVIPQFSATPLDRSGDELDVQDITARKEAEALLQVRERQLARNLAGMTRLHELGIRLARGADLPVQLKDILTTAAEITASGKGQIQLIDPATGASHLTVQHGLKQPLPIACAPPESDRSRDAGNPAANRLIIEDVRTCPALEGKAEREVLTREGVLALQSTPIVGPDRRVLGWLSNFFPIPHRPTEDELRFLDLLEGMAAEVIERAKRDAALRESDERFQRTLQIETVGIVFFRVDGGITGVNDAFLRMSGYTRQDLTEGRIRWEEMTPTEWRVRGRKAEAEFLGLGRISPREKECLRKDGSRWRALFAVTRTREDEGVEFVIDVTETNRAEQELRRYRENLELLVQQRTAELDAVNGSLRDEIVERRRAEAGRQELMRLLVTAQEAERARISRELHDEVGQHVTALLLGLKSLESAPGAAANSEMLRKLHAITETIGKEIHELALELRPRALDDLGLLRALSNYIDEWSAKTGIAADVHTSGFTSARLPSEVETTVYRIVQEALNNVLKHAQAKRVSVILEQRADEAIAIVEDDGCGFDVEGTRPVAAENRLGLLGMRERAVLAGGELKIESRLGQGTTIFVRIPLSVPPPNLDPHG